MPPATYRSRRMQVHDAEDLAINAEFSVEVLDGSVTIVLEAAGGTTGKKEVNRGRNEAFEILLARLGGLGGALRDAAVDTKATQRKGLSIDDRRLLKKSSYPIDLRSRSPRDLRLLLDNAAREPGSERTTPAGGTPWRRIRLWPAVPGYPATPEAASELALLLARGRHALAADPDLGTAAERALISVALRPEQAEFRRKLFDAYDGRCAVTSCDVEAALDAAHLVPFRRGGLTSVSNGLLLRADIHRLLDAGGLLFLPTKLGSWIISAPRLKGTAYADLHGRALRLPKDVSLRPDDGSLRWHAL